MKLSIGVVATMAALVLGLLVSSAKGSFDRTEDELTLTASKVVQLDRALAQYGAETAGMRRALRRNYGNAVDALTSDDPTRLAQLQTHVPRPAISRISCPRSVASRRQTTCSESFAREH